MFGAKTETLEPRQLLFSSLRSFRFGFASVYNLLPPCYAKTKSFRLCLKSCRLLLTLEFKKDPLTGPTPMTSGQQKLDSMCYLRKKKEKEKSYEFRRGGRVDVDVGGFRGWRKVTMFKCIVCLYKFIFKN